MLIGFLIVFFIILLTYQIILSHSREGMDSTSYQNYGNSPSLQQNAENIDYLNNVINNTILPEIEDMSKNIIQLQQQYQDLVNQQANDAQNNVDAASAPITGDTTTDQSV